MNKVFISLSAMFLVILGANQATAQYTQTNLVADVKGQAIHTDPLLVNAWGLAFFPHGPFWVANASTGTSTVYGHDGKLLPTAVTIPAAPGQPLGPIGSPTGLVANTTQEFVISKDGKSGPARFIFDTVDGLICGWNPDVDPDHAIIVIDYSVAKPKASKAHFPGSYYGLAIGRNSKGQNVIYATDGGRGEKTDNNQIDMFDGNFQYLGSFTDKDIPSSVPPYMGAFGIQNIDNKLYVSFAGFGDYQGGFVDVFDMDGKSLRRFGGNFEPLKPGDPPGNLQAPWGFAMAPSHFGKFSHALLIGNLEGDLPNTPGRIKAYDPDTGALLGVLQDRRGRPIEIGGLWALEFGTDKNANGATNELFFTAGPTFPPNTEFESDGLFGVIRPDDDDEDTD
jgi:uncharacterized protein (TIGR03118 family)